MQTGIRWQIRSMWAALGVAGAVLLWQVFASEWFLNEQFSDGFSPAPTARAFFRLGADGSLLEHLLPSLKRVGVGLGVAVAVGIPLGVVVGYFRRADLITNTVFQFIRMTSPLAWMPLAIILFGVGDKPVYFLIAIAAIWPVVINTSHGVRNVDRAWVRVVRMLGGNQWQVLWRAVIPAIIPDMLTGIRVSIGISWIILVPAEMLGVSSGLGYFILDTRDRFAYDELMATILAIGLLGMLSDLSLRWFGRVFSWRQTDDR